MIQVISVSVMKKRMFSKLSPVSDYYTVKCPECGNIIRTKRDDECQCPHNSGGCGDRVKVKENLIKV